jgi:hypothetical protein
MFVCEYCKKEFLTKGNVTAHQKTTKYCLELQGKTLSDDFQCKYCIKKFTTQTNLNDHISICKIKKKKETEDRDNKLIIEHNNQIQKMKDDYDKERFYLERDHRKEIDSLNHIISKLESKLESYEKKLFEMASRPNTTNTNNNNKTVVINNTNLPLTNDVLRQCAATLTLDNARNNKTFYVFIRGSYHVFRSVEKYL